MSKATSPPNDLSSAIPEETVTSRQDVPTDTETPIVSDQPQLSLDTVFDALRNARRRRTLQYLDVSDGSIELGELAERIAADENDKSTGEITYAERKRVYVALYQCHLPKLDDMDIVSYDESRGIVERRESAAQLRPYLEGPPLTRRWHRYYAAIIGVGVLALGGSWLLALSAGSVQLLLLSVLVAIAVCTMAHAWSVSSR